MPEVIHFYLKSDEFGVFSNFWAAPIQLDGKSVTTYHYVATWEFPYAVGCFHGTYTATGPVLKPAR